MTYLKGSTIRCKTTVTDSSGNYIDPSNIVLRIVEPDGTLSEEIPYENLVKEDTGIYYYDFLIPDDAPTGNWYYEFEIEASNINISYAYFYVGVPTVPQYCNIADVYRKAGIDDTIITENEVAEEIKLAEGEIDHITQMSFGKTQEASEWFDIDAYWDEEIADLFLTYRPIQSIVSLESYDIYGNLYKTWDSDKYWLYEDIGLISLRTHEFAHQDKRVKVVYEYGYDEVPSMVKSLTSIIAAMRAIIHQMGGTYDDVTSYSMPSGISVSLGEPYTSMKSTLDVLEREKKKALENLGKYRIDTMVV